MVGSAAARLGVAVEEVTIGYFALSQSDFEEARWVDQFDDVRPHQLLLSATPLKAIAATRKSHLRLLGVSLSNSIPPGTKTLLRRTETSSKVHPVLCEPNYMILHVRTQRNIAVLVAEGELKPSKDGGLIMRQAFDPFQMDFQEGWSADWLSLD